MRFRIPRIILFSLFLLATGFSTVAQAQVAGGENAPSQTPVQVIVQIVLTAIVLGVLNQFNLP